MDNSAEEYFLCRGCQGYNESALPERLLRRCTACNDHFCDDCTERHFSGSFLCNRCHVRRKQKKRVRELKYKKCHRRANNDPVSVLLKKKQEKKAKRESAGAKDSSSESSDEEEEEKEAKRTIFGALRPIAVAARISREKKRVAKDSSSESDEELPESPLTLQNYQDPPPMPRYKHQELPDDYMDPKRRQQAAKDSIAARAARRRQEGHRFGWDDMKDR